MQRIEKKVGEILISRGLITGVQLNEALKEQKKTKEFFGEILIKSGIVKERDFLLTLSEQFNIPLISLKDKYIDWGFVQGFSPTLVLDYKCFPVKFDDWSVTIAITNPLDAWAMKRCEEEAGGKKLNLALVSREDLAEATERYRQHMRANINKWFK